MIPTAYIMQWRDTAPWSNDSQVEQDLILSRAIICIFSNSKLSKELAMRGGTVLNKIHFAGGSRYSEDIDLVQIAAGDIGPVITEIRNELSWLGSARFEAKDQSVRLIYKVESESTIPLRLKIEINTREHFTVTGYQSSRFTIENPWFTGDCQVTTYSLNELLGTKLRAFYQRKKGRDLFDIWFAARNSEIDANLIVQCFREYLNRSSTSISRKDFESNLLLKESDKNFLNDITPLLRDGVVYNATEGFKVVRDNFIELL